MCVCVRICGNEDILALPHNLKNNRTYGELGCGFKVGVKLWLRVYGRVTGGGRVTG